MKLPEGYGRSPFRFNITPMIDVVFLLIIFFLVASYFVRSEQVRPVSLPVSSLGALEDPTALQRLTITLESGGQLSIAGQEMSEEAVFRKIDGLESRPGMLEPEVRIRSDRNARFAGIRRLIERCAAHNVRRIRFAVMGAQE